MVFVREHIKNHPKAGWQDVVKLCYQASFGAEHVMADVSAAEAYFNLEYFQLNAGDPPLFEMISEDVCRVDMRAWKGEGLFGEWLFKLFVLSCNVCADGEARFCRYMEQVKEEYPHMAADIDNYMAGGIRPLHHSDAYREEYEPHYRIIRSDLIRIIPVLMEIRLRNAKVIAIDGDAASGKTTMAEALSFVLGAGQVPLDDFFLPPALRTAERLSEPGGNVHYERFACEVLPYLRDRKEFSYSVFDCSVMDINGRRAVDASSCVIVEGSYSHHPYFGSYADLKVFSQVDAETQMERIIARNGEEMAEAFRNRWIPMEKKYFREREVAEKAHIVV